MPRAYMHPTMQLLIDKNLGWDEGVMDMTLGEKCILTISRYAYTLTLASKSSSISLPFLASLTFPNNSDYAYSDR